VSTLHLYIDLLCCFCPHQYNYKTYYAYPHDKLGRIYFSRIILSPLSCLAFSFLAFSASPPHRRLSRRSFAKQVVQMFDDTPECTSVTCGRTDVIAIAYSICSVSRGKNSFTLGLVTKYSRCMITFASVNRQVSYTSKMFWHSTPSVFPGSRCDNWKRSIPQCCSSC